MNNSWTKIISLFNRTLLSGPFVDSSPLHSSHFTCLYHLIFLDCASTFHCAFSIFHRFPINSRCPSFLVRTKCLGPPQAHHPSLWTMMQKWVKSVWLLRLPSPQQLWALFSPLTNWTLCTIPTPWGHTAAGTKKCWWLASEVLQRSAMSRFTSVP